MEKRTSSLKSESNSKQLISLLSVCHCSTNTTGCCNKNTWGKAGNVRVHSQCKANSFTQLLLLFYFPIFASGICCRGGSRYLQYFDVRHVARLSIDTTASSFFLCVFCINFQTITRAIDLFLYFFLFAFAVFC